MVSISIDSIQNNQLILVQFDKWNSVTKTAAVVSCCKVKYTSPAWWLRSDSQVKWHFPPMNSSPSLNNSKQIVSFDFHVASIPRTIFVCFQKSLFFRCWFILKAKIFITSIRCITVGITCKDKNILELLWIFIDNINLCILIDSDGIVDLSTNILGIWNW